MKPSAFEIRVKCSGINVIMYASRNHALADALAKSDKPLICAVTDCAVYNPGDIFLQDNAKLIPWEEYVKHANNTPTLDDFERPAKALKTVPVIIDTASQCLSSHAPDEAKTFAFSAKTPSLLGNTTYDPNPSPKVEKTAWSDIQELSLIVSITSPIDDWIETVTWKNIRIDMHH